MPLGPEQELPLHLIKDTEHLPEGQKGGYGYGGYGRGRYGYGRGRLGLGRSNADGLVNMQALVE